MERVSGGLSTVSREVSVLERDDVVAGLAGGDAIADRLDEAGALVAEDDGKGTLGVLARQCVGIGVADARVVDLDADFVGAGRGDLDVFDGEVFGGLPGDGGLAGDGLSCTRCGQSVAFDARGACAWSVSSYLSDGAHDEAWCVFKGSRAELNAGRECEKRIQ